MQRCTVLHWFLASLILLLAGLGEPARAVPAAIAIQGKLTGAAGRPLTGTRAWRVQFYNVPTGGTILGAALNGTVEVGATGRFTIELIPPAPVVQDSPNPVYYELAIDSAATPDGAIGPADVFPGRVKVTAVLWAKFAENSAGLQGHGAEDFATSSGLAAGLAGKADALHLHNLQALGGAVTDAQVPNNITIEHAAAAGVATTAILALRALQADLATSASHADHATSATLAQNANQLGGVAAVNYATKGFVTSQNYATQSWVMAQNFATQLWVGLQNFATQSWVTARNYATQSALTSGLAGKSDLAHSHNLQALGGAVTDAQVPDDLTITEADTLASVTARGATTGLPLTLNGGLMTTTITESVSGTGVRIENVTLKAGTAQLPAIAPPASMASKLVNTSGSLYWDGLPLLPARGEAHIIVRALSNATSNGLNLLAAYRQAKVLTPHGLPRSASNRVVVILTPGRYNLGSNTLVLNTEFVDLVGLSTAREDQVIAGQTTDPFDALLRQTANNVRIENLLLEFDSSYMNYLGYYDYDSSAAYSPDAATTATVIRNCKFAGLNVGLPTRIGAIYPGTYEDCVGGIYFFGGASVASGTFINCTGGHYAFASGHVVSDWDIGFDYYYPGTANGKFINCTGGGYSFGGFFASASGTFTNCTGDTFSFGGGSGCTFSGTCIHCTGGNYAFGGYGNTTAQARLQDCRMTGPSWSGLWRGTMQDCIWGAGMSLAATARIYNSTFVGTLNLNGTAAGVTQSRAKAITNQASNCFGATDAAAFNLANANVQ